MPAIDRSLSDCRYHMFGRDMGDLFLETAPGAFIIIIIIELKILRWKMNVLLLKDLTDLKPGRPKTIF